jgi:hypothetical protein
MYSIGDKFENKNGDIIEIVAKVHDEYMEESVYMVKIIDADRIEEDFVRFTVLNDFALKMSKKM